MLKHGREAVRFRSYPYNNGHVVQLVRMPACHAEGRGFKSHRGRQLGLMRYLDNLQVI